MIQWNESRYRFTMHSRSGTVARFCRRLGTRIESTAKRIATEEKLVRTGRYRASLAWRLTTSGSGLVLQVGSPVAYAKYLERGTSPHIILPRNPFGGLWWDMPNDRGWMVTPPGGKPTMFVFHPGNRPYQVLHRAVLRETRGGIAR